MISQSFPNAVSTTRLLDYTSMEATLRRSVFSSNPSDSATVAEWLLPLAMTSFLYPWPNWSASIRVSIETSKVVQIPAKFKLHLLRREMKSCSRFLIQNELALAMSRSPHK